MRFGAAPAETLHVVLYFGDFFACCYATKESGANFPKCTVLELTVVLPAEFHRNLPESESCKTLAYITDP